MIESSSNIPISPKKNLDNVRQRAERAETAPARENKDDNDSFEPSSELAARETGETPYAVNLDTEQEGGGSGGQEREAIGGADEAGEVIDQARNQILASAEDATSAQGNLDRDRVLSLIA